MEAVCGVMCAADYNIRWLLPIMVKKGISLFLRLLLSTGLGELGHRLRQFFIGPTVKSGSMNLNLV